MRLRTTALAAVALLVSLLPATAEAAEHQTRPVQPVSFVDLARYQGKWVQLAAIPQPFQAQCARNDSADYTVLPQGQVKVVNSCTKRDGTLTVLEGRARPEEPGTTSRLEVTFTNIGGEWNFDRPGTYWILGLDRDYRWAVVGAPDRKSGFVLSRSPRPDARQVAHILAVLVRQGYDPCAFDVTAQDGGAPQGFPVC